MGEQMTSGKLPFVSFEPHGTQFSGFLSIEGVLSNEKDPELVLRKATKVYERHILMMRAKVEQIKTHRAQRELIPARVVWRLGDLIFKLQKELAQLPLQIDDTYYHLVRDLAVRRKWLEKVVILRRYIPRDSLIPPSLSWGRCEKGTRRIAERLRDGLPLQ